MKIKLTPFFLFIIVFFSCKGKAKDPILYVPKGSILVFDTSSGKLKVSTEDKKLITTWESFREAMSKSDYETRNSLSCDSIVCFCADVHANNIAKPVDTFYKKYSEKLFSDTFISLAFDSSKVWVRYDLDSMYYNAYPFLTTISDLEKPKVAEINLSFPAPPGERVGTLGTLTFIETNSTYKFVGYFTIP